MWWAILVVAGGCARSSPVPAASEAAAPAPTGSPSPTSPSAADTDPASSGSSAEDVDPTGPADDMPTDLAGIVAALEALAASAPAHPEDFPALLDRGVALADQLDALIGGASCRETDDGGASSTGLVEVTCDDIAQALQVWVAGPGWARLAAKTPEPADDRFITQQLEWSGDLSGSARIDRSWPCVDVDQVGGFLRRCTVEPPLEDLGRGLRAEMVGTLTSGSYCPCADDAAVQAKLRSLAQLPSLDESDRAALSEAAETASCLEPDEVEQGD
jgi:hypothetical protein